MPNLPFVLNDPKRFRRCVVCNAKDKPTARLFYVPAERHIETATEFNDVANPYIMCQLEYGSAFLICAGCLSIYRMLASANRNSTLMDVSIVRSRLAST